MSFLRVIAAPLVALVLIEAALIGVYLAQPELVTDKIVARVNDEPISRWYLRTDRAGEVRWVEVGPALFDCFEVGDEYHDGSVGRCEGVVWP